MSKIRFWRESHRREWGWVAMDDDDNDGGRLVGWGQTEAEAVQDLYRLFAERDEAEGRVELDDDR